MDHEFLTKVQQILYRFLANLQKGEGGAIFQLRNQLIINNVSRITFWKQSVAYILLEGVRDFYLNCASGPWHSNYWSKCILSFILLVQLVGVSFYLHKEVSIFHFICARGLCGLHYISAYKIFVLFILPVEGVHGLHFIRAKGPQPRINL